MKILRRNKWLESDSICIAQGSSVAKNLMFETKAQHQLFFKLWDKYLGDMTEVVQYHLAPTTWTILFKTKTELDIKRAYHYQRKKSKKAKAQNTLHEPSRMLSEHFRIFLAQFVRLSNLTTGRKGTKVLHRFKKCVVNESVDYWKAFDWLTKKTRVRTQIKKYQADESRYDQQDEMEKNSIWKVGNAYYASGKPDRCLVQYKENVDRDRYGLRAVRRVDGVVGMLLLLPSNPVLRKILKNSKITKSHHPPPPI